ncbi:MAG: sigma-70 family RNA polymerase sigma factor [Sphingobacteriia bacterium]|nr:sigma-70 family RNA polymerase sigma factor [Sphingobacteriia bacterium]
MEIEEVIKYCKSGNQVAQGILFDTFYRQMYHLSMRVLFNHHDVEDVLITAFSKVFNNIKTFEYRGDNSVAKWVKTIVVNESIRVINKKPPISYSEDLPEYKTNNEYDVDLSGIDVDQIYSIIGTMPVGYRIVFNLFAIEGYTHKEISELLNIAENTSKSQLRKARIYIIEKINNNREYGNS